MAVHQIDIDDSINEVKDYDSESHDYNNFQSYENDEYDDYYDYLLNSLNEDDLSSEDLEMNDDDPTVYRDFPIGEYIIQLLWLFILGGYEAFFSFSNT